MVTIQIVVDQPLLEATDRAAQQERKNRSALVRDALREQLRRVRTRDFIAKDRAGYEK